LKDLPWNCTGRISRGHGYGKNFIKLGTIDQYVVIFLAIFPNNLIFAVRLSIKSLKLTVETKEADSSFPFNAVSRTPIYYFFSPGI